MNAVDGLVTVSSPLDAVATIDWLESTLASKGVTIFARIDHAAGAQSAGLPLGPTTVMIFGNAQAGTRLMQIDQRMGIDLPLKALVWTGTDGRTHVSYSDPAWIAARYGITPEEAPVLVAMQGMMKDLADGIAAAR